MRTGVMGGTFDPVHLAHLIIAEEARVELELDRVIFVPAGEPWMKSDLPISPAEHRVAMLRLATGDNSAFDVSTIEVDRHGPSYTVDTLEELYQEFGQANELFLLVGWDNLMGLPLWKAPYRISKLARLVSFPRPGFARPDLEELAAHIPGVKDRVLTMEKPFISISSSEIRERVAEGKSIRYLVPDGVERYIRDYGLYVPAVKGG